MSLVSFLLLNSKTWTIVCGSVHLLQGISVVASLGKLHWSFYRYFTTEFLWMHFNFTWVWLACCLWCMFTCTRPWPSVFHSARPAWVPTSRAWDTVCAMCSPAFFASVHFNHSNGCVLIFLSGFDFHLPDSFWCRDGFMLGCFLVGWLVWSGFVWLLYLTKHLFIVFTYF